MRPILFFLAVLLTVSCGPSHAGALDETRYCGLPKRNTKGDIIRRADVLAAFKKEHPCPVNGATSGSCSGWAMDHVIPLACGGCDSVSNLQWLPNGIKSAAVIGKDRFERKINGGHVDGTGCGVPPLL